MTKYQPNNSRQRPAYLIGLTLIVTSAVVNFSSAMAQTSDASWQKLDDMPVPRWEAGTVVLDSKLYVFGGYTKGTKSSKRADVFDPKDNRWTQLADLPSAITHMNAVLDGRSVWIAGGFKDGYQGESDLRGVAPRHR